MHSAEIPAGPHQALHPREARERFTCELLDGLWERYRQRVSYVRAYEELVASQHATFCNDHIALRTFACQRPLTGIPVVSRIFEALGYRPAGVYSFDDKHLSAIHYQHRNAGFPKLFISELRVWELSPTSRALIQRSLQSHREPLSADVLEELAGISQGTQRRAELLDLVLEQFFGLPWEMPQRQDLEALNRESQYAAWVLVHGYNVNHFTSLINSHGVPALADIEKTAEALRQRGVPMKTEIEGARGSKLRQTATEAVMVDVHVQDGGQVTPLPWTYAYFELAERGEVLDPASGRQVRFEGFLGPQATQLFEMTRVK